MLLDEYRGFHPYTTWSTVTTHHAWELVHAVGVDAVAVLGVTRGLHDPARGRAVANISPPS